uniref:Uncharacterized protein n=1 Tax=Vespula pensylvanica TaxID=30213 RepID=A0A834MZ04_VESPE|nr:hypothetical protein H0235_017732 [Vespula pensylvanica]
MGFAMPSSHTQDIDGGTCAYMGCLRNRETAQSDFTGVWQGGKQGGYNAQTEARFRVENGRLGKDGIEAERKDRTNQSRHPPNAPGCRMQIEQNRRSAVFARGLMRTVSSPVIEAPRRRPPETESQRGKVLAS